jgi:hypothetical protein
MVLFYMPVTHCSYIVYAILALVFLHTEARGRLSAILPEHGLRSRLLRAIAIDPSMYTTNTEASVMASAIPYCILAS